MSVSTGDEIEILYRAFYMMVQDLKSYISESIKNEKIRSKLEFDLFDIPDKPAFYLQHAQ